MLSVSVIVAVYKDSRALELIFEAMSRQTYTNFEVVVAEDGECDDIAHVVEKVRGRYGFPVKHVTQEDRGIRKSRSQNNGILAAESEYLVFIDGDCLPFTRFIEAHVKLSGRNRVVSGRRVNLGPHYSDRIRSGILDAQVLEKRFMRHLPFLIFDGKEGHMEAGIQFRPGGFIDRFILRNLRKRERILGCNFSCYRDDMFAINGFDEAYGESSFADDTDIQWRMERLGRRVVSAKFLANQFHLYHERGHRQGVDNVSARAMLVKNRQENRWRCKSGIDRH